MSNNQQKFTAFSFDASNIAPQQPLEAIPAGMYNVAITDGELEPTKDGSGTRLMLEFSVIDGPFKGRKIFDGINVKNKSAQAQEIAHQQLSGICHATGVIRLQDVRELFNKPFTAKIGYEGARKDEATGKDYEPRNGFKGAKPLDGATAAAAPGATSAPSGIPTPGWAKPAASAPLPPAASTAPSGPAPQPPFLTQPAAPAAPVPPPPAPPAPPKMVKKLVMTAKANGLSADQFRASDAAWTDELLVQHGYAEIKEEPEAGPAAPSIPSAPPAAPGGGVRPPWAK